MIYIRDEGEVCRIGLNIYPRKNPYCTGGFLWLGEGRAYGVRLNPRSGAIWLRYGDKSRRIRDGKRSA